MFPLFNLSWAGWAFLALALSQAVIFLVTVYFHRAASHRAIGLSPFAHRLFRFLSWFLIAMVPREFAAVHRKHHATCDTEQDPHSPVHHGWATVLFKGLALYRKEAANQETLEKYGKGLPADPWEGFYLRHKNLGIFLQLALLVVLFGVKGLLAWVLLMIWIPFWAAGVINGLGHHVGYRRFATEDHSTNLSPWGLWVGGEELHNNHHAYPASAKFSHAWYEVDIGWGAIVVLRALGMAKVRNVAPAPSQAQTPYERAFLRLIRDRHAWQKKLHESFDHDLSVELRELGIRSWKQIARWQDRLDRGKQSAADHLARALAHPRVAAMHEMEHELSRLWRTRFAPGAATAAMEEWLQRAQRVPAPSLHRWCSQLQG